MEKQVLKTKQSKRGNKEDYKMKNIFRSIVYYAFLTIVGLCISSCSEKENIENSINYQKTYTISVNASKSMGSLTRALSLEGKTLNAYWGEGEVVYVYNTEGTNIGTLTPNTTGSASTVLTGTITTTGLSVNDQLTLSFPRTTINYSGQDGTLSSIASKYDYAQANVTIKSINGNSITTSNASFDNQQAIVKFTLMDKVKRTAITSECFFIRDSENHLVYSVSNGNISYGSCTVYKPDGSNDNVYYVALRGVTNSNLTFESAMWNSENYTQYTYTKENVTFEPGKYYEVTMYMSGGYDNLIDLSQRSGEINVPSGKHYKFTGSSDDCYITIGSLMGTDPVYVTLSGVTMNNNNVSAPPIYFKARNSNNDGVILLEDGTTNTITSSQDGPAIYVPENSTKTLTIEGNTGVLIANGGSDAPAIGTGGNGSVTCGNLIINGGVINATGSNSGTSPAIGAGSGGGPKMGNITINGGTITAVGGRLGAGIGTGYGTCGNITINGGTIVAKGFSHCAGIGSGHAGKCGNITIGPNVTSITASCGCTGLSEDAPLDYPVDCDIIGCGYQAECGTVTIDGVENATSLNSFEHYNSVLSQTRRENDTWTLTHK